MSKYESGETIIPGRLARALCKWLPRPKDARPALSGVNVRPDGWVDACDGHLLLRFGPGAQVDAKPLFVPRATLEAVRGNAGEIRVDLEEARRAIVNTGSGVLHFEEGAESVAYPNTDAILPNPDDHYVGQPVLRIDPKNLRALADAADAIGSTQVHLTPNSAGEERAIRVQFGPSTQAHGIVMPMRAI